MCVEAGRCSRFWQIGIVAAGGSGKRHFAEASGRWSWAVDPERTGWWCARRASGVEGLDDDHATATGGAWIGGHRRFICFVITIGLSGLALLRGPPTPRARFPLPGWAEMLRQLVGRGNPPLSRDSGSQIRFLLRLKYLDFPPLVLCFT